MRGTLVLVICAVACGCTPAFCEKEGMEYEPDKCAQWLAEQQEQARQAMIFANLANGLNAAINHAPVTPAPAIYTAPPPPPSAPAYAAPVRKDTTRCLLSRNSCQRSCHPPTFGQDTDYEAVGRCETGCEADYRRCTGD